MGLNYKLITPPAVEPVTLALAKQQCRVEITDDDTLITAYITAAREHCEKIMNRAIFNQTWALYLDSFPYGDYRSTVPIDQRSPWNFSAYWSDLAIRLPKPRCVSVTSLTYLDGTGTQQTLSPNAYYVDPNAEPARITPSPGSTWPMTQFYLPNSIVVTYVAGTWGDGVTVNNCPQSVVMAILLLVSHWYQNREAVDTATLKPIPLGVNALLSSYKFVSFGNFRSGY